MSIEAKITPTREMYYSDSSSYGIYACETKDRAGIKINKYGNFSIKGNTVKLEIGNEYNASLIEREDKKYGTYYEIESIFEDIPTDASKQRDYLLCVLTEKQVEEIYKTYPDQDIIQLIKDDKFDIDRVKGVGLKTYEKIKDKIIENLEFQQAFEFLSQYGVTNNLIIKLVKHFKSASLLIKKMKDNPFSITEVSGIGFKKADAIALSMGTPSTDEFRILSAIEYMIQEEGNGGHTYCKIDKLVDAVYELLGVDINLINEQVKDTNTVIVLDDKIALKKNYRAEQYISNRLKELLKQSTTLNIDVEKFIEEQQKKHSIQLTDQQKSLFEIVKHNNVALLVGYAGVGKSQITALLIDLLDQLGITYKLLSPTGKAAKILSNYTQRPVETIHRAIGLGEKKEQEAQKLIEEEFVIVDEHSMTDAQLCAKLLRKCTNENLRLLFIGDEAQIASVSEGNLLHDMMHSGVIPTAKLDIVFRQKEGGILDVATKTRLGEKFVENSFYGLKEYGNNCTLAAVTQDKMEGGYKYFYKEMLKEYDPEDITIVTPTKKSSLGTVEINKSIQEIVNPSDGKKQEKEYGFNKTIFREGDLVINTKNSYKIPNIYDRAVDIVNGDIGKIEKVDLKEEELIIDFGFDKVPIPFKKLDQLLHAWCLTKHKMQGSANKIIIAIADKSQKFQLNANLVYTAFTRPTDRLIILSQADTLNFALKKFANKQRRTFLKDMLMSEGEVSVE
ncbi:AAA family ATPase [Fictibacillus nanhaiensis]|uniref:AAA family ATPase n=1 Tax=Fictibacillus nanhaiensis TaxID=742169 RepID=UPI002E1CA82F|nr:AAA family ATPase [Fictibacillus nanhaiensis]